MKDWAFNLDSVGVSLSVGIGFWVAHGAFGFSFSMADLKLLKDVKSLPKLSLACSPLEYFEWEESLDDFFYDYVDTVDCDVNNASGPGGVGRGPTN